jgi:ketosteroid isomerase-like protein
MSDQNVETLQQAYEAFGRGDIPAVMSVFADDIEWHVPAVLPQGMDARGKGEVAGFFAKLVEVWEDFSVDVEDYCASGDRVCVIGTGSGNLDGTQTSYGFVHSWRLKDGLCKKFDEYADPSPEIVDR